MTHETAREYEGHRFLEAMRSAPHYAEAIYRLIRSVAPATGPILDFGAGDGHFAEFFLRDGIGIECIEPDTRNMAALSGMGLKVKASLAEAGDNQFSFAYTINVLEHLHDVTVHARELHRVLQRDGRLFVFVPAFNLLWTSLDDEVAHVQRFTRRSLREVLQQAGFQVETLRYFDSAGFPAALAVKALERLGLFRYSPTTVGFYDRAILPISLAGDRFLSSVAGKNVIAIARKA